MDELGLFASMLGHIGDGNFHESIMYDRNDPTEREKVEQVVGNMIDLALEMDGRSTHSSWRLRHISLMPNVRSFPK